MNQPNNNKAHGSAITTFVGGIVILLAVLFLLVKLATSGYYSDVQESSQSATETRIMPAGSIAMGDGTPVGERTGEQIFNKICIQCHAADSLVPNSPKITHNNEWAPRIAQGFDILFTHALNGFKAMPAKGGAADLTDDELKRAIVYMTNQSGGNFEAPAVGAASDAATADASGAAASDTAAAPAAAPVAVAGGADGKKVFEGLCMACHGADSAIPFSPKITHNADWTERLKQGKATLVKHAIEGFTNPKGGVMPPKGGNANLTDAEVEAAVVYMANQSGGNF
ncbi:c-type cytochrome [Neisseria sp. S1]|uniref:c-type cytochrome n=1 Tax=Neisseria sp. S1 TaxID=3318354 RepID=UPI003A866422